MNIIHPWHKTQWQQLHQRRCQGRLPHALLLTGVTGLGKLDFSRQFAASLLCLSPTEQGHACGQCKSCLLLEAGTHPDLYQLSPEEKSKVIKVDQIRELCSSMSQTAQMSGYRVAVIYPAEAMNTNAANSLLKTLEEPGANTAIILVCSQPGSLPATVRSRCQITEFHIPDTDTSIKWLNSQGINEDVDLLLSISQNAPVAAMTAYQDGVLANRRSFIADFFDLKQGLQNPQQVADKWYKSSPKMCLEWLKSWIADLIRLKSTENSAYIANMDIEQHLQPMAKQLDLSNLFKYLEQLQQSSRLLTTQVNVQLMLEDLFIAWIKLR